MVKNLWKQIKLICGNHENEEIEMTLNQGPHSLFYSCPKYYPENREKNERACANRLNLVDFEKMLDHISDKFMEDEEKHQFTNLDGYEYKDRKGTIYHVVSHTENEIKIKVINRRALK